MPAPVRPVRASAVLGAALAALALVVGGARLAGSARQESPQTRPQASPPAQSFRSGVDLVSLAVTLTDRENHYVSGLTADDFAVYEDGVKQEISYFDHSNTPVALALLIDTSASMEDKLRTAQEAAAGFARRVRPQDLAELVDFDTHVQVLQTFTNDVALLEKAIRKTTADGSTSLYNAVYIALQEMKKLKAQSASDIRRRAIVMMSDGEDTSSLLSFDEVLELAKRSETAIYAIGTRSDADAVVNAKQFDEADFVLKQLTQQTGGRLFYPKRIDDLHGVYAQIADELASQYLLGYTSKNPKRDGAWRRIIVRTDRAGVEARARLGYFGPTVKP
jgi:Ca-activated chloride channel homolog